MKKLFGIIIIAFLLIVGLVSGTHAELIKGNFSDIITLGPWIDSRAYTTLAQADAAAVASDKPLWITQDYTLSANTTLSAKNVYVVQGTVITTTGYTLTLSGSLSAGPYQIFSGTGTVTGLRHAYPEWFGTDHDAFDKAIAASSIVELTASSYTITDEITANSSSTIFSNRKSEIIQSTSNTGAIDITASNVKIRGIKFTGPQYATAQTNENAIHAYGADSSNYITGIEITDCEMDTWGYTGILFKYVSDYRIVNPRITNVYSAGISMQSSILGSIVNEYINNVIGTPYAYGVSFTRADNDSLVTEPRSGYTTVIGGSINNVINWEGLDTHGGEHLTFIGVSGYGNKYAIGIGSAKNTAGDSTFAPLDINIVGGEWDSGVTDGTAYYGLAFVGVSGGQLATGNVKGLRLKGYGNDANPGGAVYTYSTDGVSFDIDIINPATYGYDITSESKGTKISGIIQDVWSEVGTVPMGIRFVSGDNTALLDGIHFVSSSKSATYKNGEAIRIGNIAGNVIRLGTNFNNGFTRYLNDAGDKANRGVTGLSTSGTGEDTIATTTYAANTIGNQGRITIRAAGTKTGANGNKTLKFYFGSSSVTFHAAANNTNDWRFEAMISNNATGSQSVTWTGWDGATPLQGYEVWTEDTTAAVEMKITGECANASDAITQGVWNIENN
jgi:hypothetical protein